MRRQSIDCHVVLQLPEQLGVEAVGHRWIQDALTVSLLHYWFANLPCLSCKGNLFVRWLAVVLSPWPAAPCGMHPVKNRYSSLCSSEWVWLRLVTDLVVTGICPPETHKWGEGYPRIVRERLVE
jgi:hypothetical protein